MDALSTELIIQILCFSDPASISVCQVTCRKLYYIVQQSGELQYALRLLAAGLEEGCQDGRQLPVVERRRLLEAHEDAWRTANFVRIQRAISPQATFDTRYIITSRGRLFTTSGIAPIDFWSWDLPTPLSDSEGLSNSPNSVLELGGEFIELEEEGPVHRAHVLCVAFSEEQDLVVLIIFNGSPDSPELKLKLLKLSTLEPHPDAIQHEVILCCRSTVLYHEQYAFNVQIVPADVYGDMVVFAVPFTASDVPESEKLNLDDLQTDCYCLWWKQGTIRTLRTFEHSLYSIAFIAPYLLLFLQPSKRRLEICGLTSLDPPAALETVIFLGLPTPSDGTHYHHFGKLRTSPSVAVAQTTPDWSHTRYRSSPSAAIIAFQVYVQDDEDGVDTHTSFWEPYSSHICVVRRLDIVKFAHSDLAGASSLSTLSDSPITSPWQEWTKNTGYYWEDVSPHFLSVWTTHGQRLILIRGGSDETEKRCVEMLDFNPVNVQRACHLYSPNLSLNNDAGINLPNGNRLRVKDEDVGWTEERWTGWFCSGEFKEILKSTMVHLSTVSKLHDLQRYDDLLADDDKIIGANRTTSQYLHLISRIKVDVLQLG